MKTVFEKPKALNDKVLSFCGGCGHGLVMRMIAESLEELDVVDRTIFVNDIGCCAPSWQFVEYNSVSGPHGRAPTLATGIKRCNPEKVVYTYQGDGACGAIGMAETQWAAIRGENITMFHVNNTNYGMTGGQLAPTTLEGQVTTTSPRGRDTSLTGMPLHLPEQLAQLPRTTFVARVSLHDTAQIRNAKKQIKKAFEAQLAGGYSFVEILSPCPSNWHMSPVKAMDRVRDEMVAEFPIGVFKDWKGEN